MEWVMEVGLEEVMESEAEAVPNQVLIGRIEDDIEEMRKSSKVKPFQRGFKKVVE